jgi:hypothetical protein
MSDRATGRTPVGSGHCARTRCCARGIFVATLAAVRNEFSGMPLSASTKHGAVPVDARVSSIPNPIGGGPGMHSVFYIIGVIVVVLAILSLLGLT